MTPICDLSSDLSWAATATVLVLAAVAMWLGYGVGSAVGEWRARRR